MRFFELLHKVSPQKTLLILLLSLIYGVASGLFPMAVMQAVTDILAGTHYGAYAFILPVMVVIAISAKRLVHHYTAQVTEAAVKRLTLHIADTIRQNELREFEQRDQSAIYLSIVDARIITTAATKSVEVAQQAVTLITGWAAIFTLSRPAGILLAIAYLLLLLLYEVFRAVARDHFQHIAQTEGRLFNLFRHLLDGFAELKIHHPKHRDLYAKYLAPGLCKLQDLRYRSVMWRNNYDLCVDVVFYTVLAIDVFVFAAFAPSVLITEVLVMSLYLVKPVFSILAVLPLVVKGETALSRLSALTDTDVLWPAGISPAEESLENRLPPLFREMALQDVTFTYHDRSMEAGFTIGPINLSLRQGELLFFAGGNGSGKSTLLKLLAGLYPPDSGTIMIDGHPALLADYRDLAAAIFTDFHLFDDLYGIATVDEARLDRLLQQMELAGKTAYRQRHFQTLDLSAGQRKRLALVVALLEDKPVYLFDEWAADQDPHFRRYFYEELLPQLKALGKTIIAVTHDDQFYHVADRVVLMDEGRIVEVWNPQTEPERRLRWGGERRALLGQQPTAAQVSPTAVTSSVASSDTAILSWMQIKPQLFRLGWLVLLSGVMDAARAYVLFHASTVPGGASSHQLFIGFLLIFLLYIICAHRIDVNITLFAEHLVADQRLDIIDAVRSAELLAFEGIGVARLTGALTTDMLAISDMSYMIAASLRIGTRMCCMLTLLAFIAPKLFLGVIVLLGGVGLGYAYHQFRIKQAVDQRHDAETQLFRAIMSLLAGFKELRLNTNKRADFFQRGVTQACAWIEQRTVTALRYQAINYMLVYAAYMGSLALLPLLLPAVSPLSFGVVALSIGLILGMPVNILIEIVPHLLQAAFSIHQLTALKQRLTTLASEPEEVAESDRRLPFRHLSYRDLRFQYPTQDDIRFAVGPATFELRAGEIVFLTGGNGSGKTTLFKLLAGLYAADSGQVTLNGEAVDVRQHRYLFSAVFNEAHLFDRLYGLESVDADQVNQFLAVMQLDRKVQYADDRFSTLDLSTGQRKRLALICAMLEDRPIYLFDEWAAGQDPAFRHYFYDTLLPQFKAQGKSVIAVTHDDRYFHVADRVLKMEYGQIMETGS